MTAATELVCGTRAGYERHRRRGEVVDAACQAAKDAREHDREEARATAPRVRRPAETWRREPRVVRLTDGRRYGLGAYAASGAAHPFVPDGGTSTSCMLCFGWSNDSRHTSTVRAAS